MGEGEGAGCHTYEGMGVRGPGGAPALGPGAHAPRSRTVERWPV